MDIVQYSHIHIIGFASEAPTQTSQLQIHGLTESHCQSKTVTVVLKFSVFLFGYNDVSDALFQPYMYITLYAYSLIIRLVHN